MIPEELIMDSLKLLLESSDPGDTIHQMHVVSCPSGAISPLGLPDPEKLATVIYGIDYAHPGIPGKGDVTEFIREIIANAALEHLGQRKVVLFAALNQEMWSAPMDELGHQLMQENKLFEHPEMVEATVMYAACRDGRRWRGRKYLTGPDAGKTEDVAMLVGPPQHNESNDIAVAPLIRKLVGM